MAERTAVAAGGVWTTAATWSPEGVPTAEDDLKITATCTGNITVSAAAKCRSFDTTGYKKTLKVEKTLSVGGATVNGTNLAIRLGAETVVETPGVGAISLVCSKAAATQEVFCNGATFAAFKVSAGATVKVKFGDQFITSAQLELVKGIIEVGASGWKVSGFLSEGESTRELKMGSGTLKMTGGNWGTSGANLTVTKETSTLELTSAASMGDGSSFSYNVVTISHSVGGMAIGKGSPTITTLNVNPTGTGSVEFREGSTVTVTTLATTATSEAKIKVKSGSKGVKYAIKATAKQTITGWELEDCEALGGINFIDKGGVDLGNNVNWTFEAEAVTLVAAKMVLKLADLAEVKQAQAVASKTVVTFTTKQQTVQTHAVAAKSLVTLGAKTQPSQLQQPAARIAVKLSLASTSGVLQRVAARIGVVVKATISVSTGAISRRVQSFMVFFEDDD